MARAGRPLSVPGIEEIIWLNRDYIKRSGGLFAEPDNLLNRNSLEWVLEAVTAEIQGQELYPSLAHKTAIIAWTIIASHVFRDGNKRTGMATAHLFLRANGFRLDITPEENTQIALAIADREASGLTLEQLVEWFQDRIGRSTDTHS